MLLRGLLFPLLLCGVCALAQTPAPPNPLLPLTPSERNAYSQLYAEYQKAIENTIDVRELERLNAMQMVIGDLLTQDAINQKRANTVALTRRTTERP